MVGSLVRFRMNLIGLDDHDVIYPLKLQSDILLEYDSAEIKPFDKPVVKLLKILVFSVIYARECTGGVHSILHNPSCRPKVVEGKRVILRETFVSYETLTSNDCTNFSRHFMT